MKNTAVYALTPQGVRLAETLAGPLEADLFLSARLAGARHGRILPHDATLFGRLSVVAAKNFPLYPRHVFIAAAGIVVRVISPYLKSKDRDPAVIVLDQEGKYAVSLLSGHLGGANELARKVAGLTGGRPVITTATDTAGLPSMDLLAREKDLIIFNLEAVKTINMAMLSGEPVRIFDPDDRLGLKDQERAAFYRVPDHDEDPWPDEIPGVCVTWKNLKHGNALNRLILHPKCLVAGVGCNRGTGGGEILNLIMETFRENALALKSLKCLTTIEAKRNEEGLWEAARELDVPLIFFNASEIQTVQVPHPSDVVRKHMGVSSVCEATALLKTDNGKLLIPKIKSKNATLAVALENSR